MNNNDKTSDNLVVTVRCPDAETKIKFYEYLDQITEGHEGKIKNKGQALKEFLQRSQNASSELSFDYGDDIKEFRTSLQTLHSEMLSIVKSNEAKIVNQKKENEKIVEQIEKEKVALEDEIASKSFEINALHKEQDELKGCLVEKEQEIDNQNAKIKDLLERVKKFEDEREGIASLAKQLQETRDEANSLHDKLSESEDKKKILEKEISNLEQIVSKMETDIKNLRHQIESISQEEQQMKENFNHQIQTLSKEKQELEKSIQTYLETIDQLKAQLSKEEGKVISLKTNTQSLEQKIEMIKEHYKTQNDELKRHSDAEIQMLKKELDHTNKTIETLLCKRSNSNAETLEAKKESSEEV